MMPGSPYGGPPVPQAPACLWHPDRQAVTPCANCGRPICPACVKVTDVGYLCPACIEGVSQAMRAQRAAAPKQTFRATTGLVLANIAMFVLSLLSSGSNAGNALGGGGFGGLIGGDTPLMDRLAIYGSDVDSGQYYRLVTAMFMHFGIVHIAMNMWALWMLGRSMESALGQRRFLMLYVLSGLGGNVAAWLFQPNALTAGASTAIFGLFAALFVTLRRLGRDTSSVLPVIILNLIFTISVPGISIAGHLGGFVTGAVVGAAFVPYVRERVNAANARPVEPGAS